MARAALFVLALIAVASCGGHRSAAPKAQAKSARAPLSSAAHFTDANPHEGAALARRYPVHGIDISRYQSQINWPLARAGGVNFAFIKATEGGDIVDPMFAAHWQGAAQAGVARGAYHFYYHCRPADQQARWFIAHVPRSPGALPPVLDMEWTPDSPTCPHRRDATEIRRDIATYTALIRAYYGTAPILYTTTDFFEDNALWQVQDASFWLRSVAAHPSKSYAGQHWTFWQYTATGRAAGITGNVDLNAFAGTPAAWADWLDKRAQR